MFLHLIFTFLFTFCCRPSRSLFTQTFLHLIFTLLLDFVFYIISTVRCSEPHPIQSTYSTMVLHPSQMVYSSNTKAINAQKWEMLSKRIDMISFKASVLSVLMNSHGSRLAYPNSHICTHCCYLMGV